MHLEAASIEPERIQYHPAGPPPGSGDPTSAQPPCVRAVRGDPRFQADPGLLLEIAREI